MLWIAVRILFLSPRQCWPAVNGARLREYHCLRALGRHAAVTYVYFSGSGEKPLTPEDLPFCERIIGVPKSKPYQWRNLLRGLAGNRPLSVLNYMSTEMRRALATLPAPSEFDLVHVDSIHMMGYAELFPRAKIVYNWHNIESELMRRYSSTVHSRVRSLYAAHTAAKLERLEQEILRTAFGHVVCSERERAQLQRLAPAARIAVMENGVDIQYFAASKSQPETAIETPFRIVFAGKMDYYPNVDAMTWFARGIWPAIRKRIPSIRLSIVGADPAPAVTALREIPGVEVTGTVSDLRPYYRGALAAVVPLRTGGGTRLKILEAMAARVPVVSTQLGAEGLGVTPGRDILIASADAAPDWVERLARLADSPGERARIASAAFDLVESRHDWTLLGESLWSTYDRWLRGAG
jgi:sugar transferase (PEP-CTERM/EpsH1 system associated)